MYNSIEIIYKWLNPKKTLIFSIIIFFIFIVSVNNLRSNLCILESGVHCVPLFYTLTAFTNISQVFLFFSLITYFFSFYNFSKWRLFSFVYIVLFWFFMLYTTYRYYYTYNPVFTNTDFVLISSRFYMFVSLVLFFQALPKFQFNSIILLFHNTVSLIRESSTKKVSAMSMILFCVGVITLHFGKTLKYCDNVFMSKYFFWCKPSYTNFSISIAVILFMVSAFLVIYLFFKKFHDYKKLWKAIGILFIIPIFFCIWAVWADAHSSGGWFSISLSPIFLVATLILAVLSILSFSWSFVWEKNRSLMFVFFVASSFIIFYQLVN